MATSSIFHDFVLADVESIERFITAIEASEADYENIPKRVLPGRRLTDAQEILALMAKRNER